MDSVDHSLSPGSTIARASSGSRSSIVHRTLDVGEQRDDRLALAIERRWNHQFWRLRMQHTTIPEPPGFAELSKAEQVRYVQHLWDRIAEKPEELPQKAI
jgi:hypothetical protein